MQATSRLRPWRTWSLGEKSLHRTPKMTLKSWIERSAVRGADLDPEAVLRVSFLRGLRVLRVHLRRRDA